MGKPGFPIPPPANGPGPHAGVWGNPVSPSPRPRTGLALTQGCGETRFPHLPPAGGHGPPRNNLLFIGGGAAGLAHRDPVVPPVAGARPGADRMRLSPRAEQGAR